MTPSRRPARRVRAERYWHAMLLATVIAMALAACGDGDEARPTRTSWTPEWEAIRDLESTLDRGSDDTDACGEFLGDVRTRRNQVIPTPDESLDEPVEQWVEEAETIGLDCNREGDLDERLRDLDREAARIDSLIDTLEANQG